MDSGNRSLNASRRTCFSIRPGVIILSAGLMLIAISSADGVVNEEEMEFRELLMEFLQIGEARQDEILRQSVEPVMRELGFVA